MHYSAVLHSNLFLPNEQELLLLLTLEGSVVTVLFYTTQISSTAICLFLEKKSLINACISESQLQFSVKQLIKNEQEDHN